MYHIQFSSSLKSLADCLCRRLDDHIPSNFLIPYTIIVPNHDTARWLKLFIAEKNGIAANLQILLPAEWQWLQVRKLFPDLPVSLGSDIEPLKWSLFELLMDTEERHEFPLLEQYVHARGAEVVELAVSQLSDQIASAFDQYLTYRPDMLLRWQNGSCGTDSHEAWQSALWRKLCLRWEMSEHQSHFMNKAELYAQTCDAVRNGGIRHEEPIFCFNPGLNPKPLVTLLQETGRYSSVFLFLMVPTRHLQQYDNKLLETFGYDAARISSLYHVPDAPTDYLSDTAFPDSVLGHIKRSVTHNEPIQRMNTILQPESIQIRSCHSPLREIETLHHFLLECFENDDTLRPDDILVSSPDIESYIPYIRAVFDNPEDGQPSLPYDVAGFRQHSDLDMAFRHLLMIPDSRFHFSQVMDFFSMKPVREKFGISDSAVALVKRWMQENQVIWGMNAGHRADFGQPDDELQTWQNALRRGWLGQWIGETDAFQDTAPLLYKGVQNISHQETWAAFSSFLHQLDNLRVQIKSMRSIPEWCNWMKMVVPRFILNDASNETGGTDGWHLMKIADRLSDASSIAQSITKVSFSLFRNEIMKQLESTGAAGARFTRGITFSSMVPVRSLPFRMIALVGLNEDSFPRRSAAADFDLMSKRPLEGERNRKQEDRNLFLESILAAGDVHYCSYLGQSPADNETIPASTVVSEWVDTIKAVTGFKESQIVKKESLTGFSPSAFQSNYSYSKNYYMAVKAMHRNKHTAINGMDPGRALPPHEEMRAITVDDLTRFFKNPMTVFLKKRFGIFFEDADHDKEEFELGHLETYLYYQKVLGWLIMGKCDEEINTLLTRAGIVPSGWPGQKISNTLVANARLAIDYLHQKEIDLKMNKIKVSFTLNNNKIDGLISTYSNDIYLEINPSKPAGGNLVQSWIRHLCRLESGGSGSSWLLCDLKKGTPVFIRFDDPGNAGILLSDLLQLYHEGLIKPLKFFPRTLTEFIEHDESKRKMKAKIAFEGGYNVYGEQDNLFIQTILGSDAEFSDEFLDERFLAAASAMIKQKVVDT